MTMAVCVGWKGQFSLLNTLEGMQFVPERLELGQIYRIENNHISTVGLESLIEEVENTIIRKQVVFALPKELAPFEGDFAKMLIWLKTASLFPGVVVHYHNDADGISSAILIKKLLRHAQFHAHPSAVYTLQEAVQDLSQMQVPNKFVVFLDCGSNAESKEGIEFLRRNRVNVLSIDHHACEKDVSSLFTAMLNPFAEGKHALTPGRENYPTGYLVNLILAPLGLADDCLAEIACAGDHAKEVPAEIRAMALALDFAAFYQHKRAHLSFYERLLKDKETWFTFYTKAEEQLQAAKEKAKRLVKRKVCGNVVMLTLNLDKVVEEGEFPNRAKVATALLLEEEHSPTVCIGIGRKRIILRSKGSPGVLAAIERVKDTYRDKIKSGGGHEQAASLAVEEGYEETIANALEEAICSGARDG